MQQPICQPLALKGGWLLCSLAQSGLPYRSMLLLHHCSMLLPGQQIIPCLVAGCAMVQLPVKSCSGLMRCGCIPVMMSLRVWLPWRHLPGVREVPAALLKFTLGCFLQQGCPINCPHVSTARAALGLSKPAPGYLCKLKCALSAV